MKFRNVNWLIIFLNDFTHQQISLDHFERRFARELARERAEYTFALASRKRSHPFEDVDWQLNGAQAASSRFPAHHISNSKSGFR